MFKHRYVIKRSGERELVSFDKISKRIEILSAGLEVDFIDVVQKTIAYLQPDIKTSELDVIAARYCEHKGLEHYDYLKLAGRISMSNMIKNIDILYEHVDSHSSSYGHIDTRIAKYAYLVYNNKNVNNESSPLMTDLLYHFIIDHQYELEKIIQYDRNNVFSYSALQLLLNGYLLFSNAIGKRQVVEDPQMMYMRIALGIVVTYANYKEEINTNNINDLLAEVKVVYDYLSLQIWSPATPVIFNAGNERPQLSSCFLLQMTEDSLDGIYDTLKRCALLSKYAGGIGLSIHNIRVKNSYIQGTNGSSNGICPMLKVFNDTALYVDQCFDKKTKVLTGRGFVEIQSITINDVVLTRNGYKKILKVIKWNKEKTFYRIKCLGNDVIVTEDHKILVYGKENRWKKVLEISREDKLVFPIPCTPIDDDIDEINFYIYGIYLNNGFINKNNILLIYSKDLEEMLKKAKIRYELQNNRVVINILNLQITEKQFKDYEFVNILFKYPQHKVLNFIKGILKYSKLETIYRNKINYIKLILKPIVSHLKIDISTLLANLQLAFMKCKTYTISEKGYLLIPLTEQIAEITNRLVSEYDGFIVNDKNIIIPILEIEKIGTNTSEVYDLEIDGFKENLFIPEQELLEMGDPYKAPHYITELGLVHNGGGKRKGNFAIYLEMHHADIFDFLNLKDKAAEGVKALDLMYALWISDYFMECVENNADWYLMCPNQSKGLEKVHSQEYTELYKKYISQGKYITKIKAQELWRKILLFQIENGLPYILFKDNINRKSNHNHLGTLTSSNLCTEIMEITTPDEVAVCTLSSIVLHKFCKIELVDNISTVFYDYQGLYDVTRVITRNLNKVVDINYYPIPEAKKSNEKHRNIGIGVQGLANVYMIFKIGFDSPEAYEINRKIFETIYFAALTESCEIAKKDGPYPTFAGSMLSKGIFHFELCEFHDGPVQLSGMWDWNNLRKNIIQYGTRNSLVCAPMPTGSTSQIIGSVECFEPIKSNVYLRNNKSGDFIKINEYLIEDLIKLKIWDESIRQEIMASDGNIGEIYSIPKNIRDIYKTVWELDPKHIINQALDRGAFIDQGQSMNQYRLNPSINQLNRSYFHIWKRGGKNGCYYLHTRAEETQKISLPASMQREMRIKDNEKNCPVDCASCSS